MNIFDEVGKIYSEIDNSYAGTEIQARSKGYRKKEAEYSRKRQLNDQAYFLFMFTQLEGKVRDISNILIANKVAARSSWKVKRVWEIFQKQKSTNSLHFMNRVALLTPKGQADYNLVKQYYDQPNNVGHGRTFTIIISIPIVIADMKRLYKTLAG